MEMSVDAVFEYRAKVLDPGLLKGNIQRGKFGPIKS